MPILEIKNIITNGIYSHWPNIEARGRVLPLGRPQSKGEGVSNWSKENRMLSEKEETDAGEQNKTTQYIPSIGSVC